MAHRTKLGVIAAAASFFTHASAAANEVWPATTVTAPPAQATPEVAWQDEWRPVAPWEYVATFGVLRGAFYLRFGGPEPPDNWRGGILFDDAIGERARLGDPKLSGHVGTMTDVLYFGSMAYRLVDTALVPTVGYGDFELAQNLMMIDLESFSLVAGVMFGTQVFVGRQRPEYDDTCGSDATAAEQERCRQNGSRLRSFIAGHPATVLTATGLTCTHHSHIPLYGGGWGDVLACGLTLGAAAFTGAGRVQAGKHYPSDLVLGLALGTVAGWVLPRALHYGFGDEGYYDTPRTEAAESVSHQPVLVSIQPFVEESQGGVHVVGIW